MALIHSFEKSGNFLFRHRGQIPVILFLAAIPVIYATPSHNIEPVTKLLIDIFAVLLSLFGFVIRIWAIGTIPKGTSGRNTRAGQIAEELNTSGIYSLVRHPLYLGNYFMWTGIVVFTYNPVFIVIVSLLFWLYYERIMFAEERFLERKFGEEYLLWSQRIPAFIPKFRRYLRNTIPFSVKSVMRREYSGFLATVIGFVFVDHLRYYFEHDTIEIWRVSTFALAIAVVTTLILRTLKHNTTLLDEEDRS
jgi:protein-S-isoprenylcysteine O-methyltransferase Ste14